jgi:DegV family protein with EDD domain
VVKIVTDTLSSIPLQVAEEHGIPMLPQIIIFGEESYRDDTEMDTDTFLERLRTSPILPKTAAPPPALYTPIFEQLVSEGHTVICLHPSTELSGTVRSATVAAQDFPAADIRIVDTRTVGSLLAEMVFLADQWAREGVDADTIVARVHDLMARQRVYFVVDTLEYLHKGGRIGGAKALVGGMLQVKPILALRDGRVEPLEQQRTKRRALARLRELVLDECPRSADAHLCVMHADAETEAHSLADEFAAALGLSQVPVYLVPPAIVVHGGPGVLAAAFFTAPA